MSIYIMTHKPFEQFTTSKDYKTLLLGAGSNQGLDDYYRDNDFSGHIAEKNANFCELTGAYWIWKQSSEAIVGLVHYRRFFCNKGMQPIEMVDIEKYLETYDIILPQRQLATYFKIPFGMRKHFGKVHGPDGIKSWAAMSRVLKEQHPEMVTAFEQYEYQKSGYFYNMCIMPKHLFDAYHEWLFNILFQVEKELDITEFSPYNQRMFGFLSERLMTFWVDYHQLTVKELPVVFTEKPSILKQLKMALKRNW